MYVIVASNCTDLLQPLDLSINKFCEIKVPGMYGGIICKQLEEEIEEEVDMRLSVIRLLIVYCIIDFYHYIETHLEIPVNGFNAVGIKNMHAA